MRYSMLQYLAFSFFIAGLSGTSFLVIRKWSLVQRVGDDDMEPLRIGERVRSVLEGAGDKFEELFESFSWNLMLQTFLSRIRVFILRIDSFVASQLSKMREKTKKQKEREDYWRKISGLVKKDEEE